MGLGLMDLGSEGALAGAQGRRQDGVQGPGEYFGLDPWGSVQEAARPSNVFLILEREGVASSWNMGSIPCWATGALLSLLQGPGVRTGWPCRGSRSQGTPNGSSGSWAKMGVWSPWDLSSSIGAGCSPLCGLASLVLVAV